MNKASASQPQPNATELLRLAMERHQQGDLYEADMLYEQALRIAPTNGQALRLRGILARERGDLAVAQKLLRAASDAEPANPEPLSELALCHIASGDLDAAEQLLGRALRGTPDNLRALTNLGALLQHRNHLQAAIDVYRQALELDDADPGVRCNLAKTLADAGQQEAALQECELAIAASNNHPATLATLGAVLTDAGEYAEAFAALNRAVELNPNDDMALVNLALCHYQNDAIGTATTCLQQALAANPYNARAVADLANCQSAAGNNAAALELCEQFLAANPGERLVLGAYALALHNAGRSDDATALTDCAQLVRVYDLPLPDGYPNMAEFNQELAMCISNDPSLLANPVSKATTGGAQTGELKLHEPNCLQSLGARINAAVNEAVLSYTAAGLTTHPVMQPAARDWSLRAWGTVLRDGGHQTPHMHPLGWLSGVYYAHLPAELENTESAAGALQFGCPPERLFRATEPATYDYKPSTGRLILFPSWFWHQTIPFESTEQRISIAFDIMPHTQLRQL